MTLGDVTKSHGPLQLTGGSVEGNHPRIGSSKKDLVFVNGKIATHARIALGLNAEFMLPDQIAGASIQCLHYIAVIGQIDDAVMHQR